MAPVVLVPHLDKCGVRQSKEMAKFRIWLLLWLFHSTSIQPNWRWRVKISLFVMFFSTEKKVLKNCTLQFLGQMHGVRHCSYRRKFTNWTGSGSFTTSIKMKKIWIQCTRKLLLGVFRFIGPFRNCLPTSEGSFKILSFAVSQKFDALKKVRKGKKKHFCRNRFKSCAPAANRWSKP
jgi:hypothetical protein